MTVSNINVYKMGLDVISVDEIKNSLKLSPGLGRAGIHRTVCRHRIILREPIQGITKSAIRRLARRGGVKRISLLVYEKIRDVLKIFLEDLIRDVVTYTEFAKRKTISVMDVVHALKNQGRTLYGFGG